MQTQNVRYNKSLYVIADRMKQCRTVKICHKLLHSDRIPTTQSRASLPFIIVKTVSLVDRRRRIATEITNLAFPICQAAYDPDKFLDQHTAIFDICQIPRLGMMKRNLLMKSELSKPSLPHGRKISFGEFGPVKACLNSRDIHHDCLSIRTNAQQLYVPSRLQHFHRIPYDKQDPSFQRKSGQPPL